MNLKQSGLDTTTAEEAYGSRMKIPGVVRLGLGFSALALASAVSLLAPNDMSRAAGSEALTEQRADTHERQVDPEIKAVFDHANTLAEIFAEEVAGGYLSADSDTRFSLRSLGNDTVSLVFKSGGTPLVHDGQGTYELQAIVGAHANYEPIPTDVRQVTISVRQPSQDPAVQQEVYSFRLGRSDLVLEEDWTLREKILQPDGTYKENTFSTAGYTAPSHHELLGVEQLDAAGNRASTFLSG